MKGGSTSAMADPCLNRAYIVTEFQNVFSIAVQCTIQMNKKDQTWKKSYKNLKKPKF